MKKIGIYFATGIFTIVLMSVFCFLPEAFAEKQASTTLAEELDLSLGELLNLHISVATKTETTVQEAPSIVSVITGEEIRNMGAKDIIDVLRTVPGFDLTESNNTPGQIMDIRGIRSQSFNRKVKIMIDGHSMQAMYFTTPYDHFRCLPVANIKQIEIIRGPGSALYGTGAFMGVVNIITKDGGDEPSRMSFDRAWCRGTAIFAIPAIRMVGSSTSFPRSA